MGRVLTNTVTLLSAVEASLGTQPSTGWKVVEPNSIGKFGPMLKKMTREPISKNRMRRKGALVDLDSSVEFECDITYDHMKMFVEGLMFSIAKGATVFTPTAVTATGFTVASGGAIPDGTLFVTSGFANSANNGLKVAAGTSTATEIKAAGLVAEGSPPAGAILERAGVQGATADITINAAGNLQSTAYNWLTTSQLTVGQYVWVGDTAGGTNSFATAANRGLARVTSISATIVGLENKGATFVADPGTGKQINVYWGQFIRNVAVDSADYLERTYHFELAYENLGVAPGTDEYEYAAGNFANEFVIDVPVASKATLKTNFVGTTTGNPTTVRATGASTATPMIRNTAVNTSVDLLRLRVTKVDETGLTTDFKSLSVTIRNNVSPEKVLGTLGGKYMNAGLFDVEINASVLFTSSDVIKAMRDNSSCAFEVCCRNEDGAFVLDVPAMCIEDGNKEFPVNQTVSIAMKSYGHQDPVLGYSAAFSTFPFLPVA